MSVGILLRRVAIAVGMGDPTYRLRELLPKLQELSKQLKPIRGALKWRTESPAALLTKFSAAVEAFLPNLEALREAADDIRGAYSTRHGLLFNFTNRLDAQLVAARNTVTQRDQLTLNDRADQAIHTLLAQDLYVIELVEQIEIELQRK